MNSSFDSFFKEHETFLSEHYPGLRVLRLVQEFEDCTHLSKEEFQKKVLTGMPLEYISNISHFYRSSFFVDERVLIPRSETEILVEDSIDYIKKNRSKKIFEIGIGSGCISISIALECSIEISASDISKEAMEVAVKNIKNHNVNINVLNLDLIDLNNRYDFIVSNPPYIRFECDKEGVHHQTNKYEPHIALYLKDSIFDSWFNKLFSSTSHCLNDDGAFFMEGHEDSLMGLKEIALNYYKKVDIKKDYTGRDRFLYCYK